MTTFTKLKSDIADELERSDLGEPKLADFVARCEDMILRKLPKLRTTEELVFADLDSARIQLPEGYLSLRRKYFDTVLENRKITYMSPDRFYSSRIYGDAGHPEVFTIEGDEFVFAPAPSADDPVRIRINYNKSFDRLSDDTDTNWLLTNQYELYLYGSLIHAGNYTREPRERIADWKGYFAEIIEDIKDLDKKGKFFYSGLIRTGGSVA